MLIINNYLMIMTILFSFLTFLISYNTGEEFNGGILIGFCIVIFVLIACVLVSLFLGLK